MFIVGYMQVQTGEHEDIIVMFKAVILYSMKNVVY